MLDSGEGDFAFKIASTALDTWKREVDYSYYTFEMVNVVTGRGGWFHNFGGLSAPINLWAAAYYKPVTFNTGLDVWVEKQSFPDDNKKFDSIFTYHGNSEKYTVIVTLDSAKKDYVAKLDGKMIDYVLRDEENVFRLFIYGDLEHRKARVMERHPEVKPTQVVDVINKTDRRRASYYNFYTGGKWGKFDNYDMLINSSTLGIDGSVQLVCASIRKLVEEE
jgi:hypothetical protein